MVPPALTELNPLEFVNYLKEFIHPNTSTGAINANLKAGDVLGVDTDLGQEVHELTHPMMLFNIDECLPIRCITWNSPIGAAIHAIFPENIPNLIVESFHFPTFLR